MLSFLKNKSAWFWAFVGTAVALIGVTVALIIVAASGPQVPDAPPELPDGAETGVYYYDTVDGEITLALNSGNAFSLAGGNDLNKSGTYTVDGTTITLDFARDDDGEATAVIEGDTIKLSYNDAVMTFLKKINYTVTFNTNGGTTIDSVQVLNGKVISKPSDPKKSNSLFLGWYSDEALTKAYDFSAPITANTTVYASWETRAAGSVEYTVNFDLAYDGAPALDPQLTFNGKVLVDRVTVPEREGYTFAGWYVSMYADPAKLTYEVNESTVLTGDVTLYALWNDSSKTLQAPGATVSLSGIKWSSVPNATSYTVKIYDANGNEQASQSGLGATTYSYDFSNLPAGDYKIEVTAVGSGNQTSDVAVRYFRNKSLDMVSGFKVINGIFIFSPVEKAEKYIITVDCGNKAHNHTAIDNGASNVFNFNNCSMQKGGIKFTVVASAAGYADSVPAVFVYENNLSKVEGLVYDATRDAFVWDTVENAVSYKVTVTVGDVTKTYVVNKPIITVGEYTGNIKVSVVPCTDGFNSPDATEATYKKEAPVTPGNISVSGTVISWDDLGADSYVLTVNGKTFTPKTNSYDLYGKETDLNLSVGDVFEVTVSAIKGGKQSGTSAPVSVCYRDMSTSVTYKSNTVSWPFVFGYSEYEVVVNNGTPVKLEGVNSLKIALTGRENVIKVRCTDLGADAEWATTKVTAYKVTYFSRIADNDGVILAGDVEKWYAFGDTLENPTYTNDGYTFNGWYNIPGGAAGNGKEFTETVFNQYGDYSFYANWKPNDYKVTLVPGEATIENGVSEVTVTYKQNFTLPIPVSSKDAQGYYFIGWYTSTDFTDENRLTDESGNSLKPYDVKGNISVYPNFAAALVFTDLGNGTFKVSKGDGIVNRNYTTLHIPHTYTKDNVTGEVVEIADFGFTNCKNITKVEIPDSVTRIGQGAFDSSNNIEAFEVYKTTNANSQNAVYSSADGALLELDATNHQTYLAIFPKAKTGTYTVSEKVDTITTGAFKNCSIEKVIISANVTEVAESAFEKCNRLTAIEFAYGRSNTVTIHGAAFRDLPNVTSLKLPALMGEFEDVKATLDVLESLSAIEVEDNNAYYKSVQNFLCDNTGFKLLYVPKKYAGVDGVFEMPQPIREISDGVFAGNTALKKVIIPTHVVTVGAKAFKDCTSIAELVFSGPRSVAAGNLTIGESAFEGCTAIKNVTFAGSENVTGESAKITLASKVFFGCTLNETVSVEAGVYLELGESVFEGNSNLKNFNVSAKATVPAIPNYAFKGCLVPEFIVPKDVKTVGNGAFEDCSALNTFGFADGIGEVEFGTDTFKNCIGLTTIKLPATVSGFDGSDFAGVQALSTIIVDPANPYLVDYDGALYSKIDGADNALELVYYPRSKDGDLTKLHANTVKIGNSVFQGNIAITVANIPANVSTIGDNAFADCVNLESVTFANNNISVYIGAMAFANCDDLTSVSVSTTRSTANSLPAGTTYIGSGAFINVPLTSMTIPESCTVIGLGAFANTKLASVNIPASVRFIGGGAFYGIEELTEVTFDTTGSASLEIGNTSSDYGVANGGALKVELGENITGTFTGTNITNVVLPKRTVSIGHNAFANVTTLSSVTVPADASGLKEIGNFAFRGTSIESINLPQGLVKIGYAAFENTKLAAVEIPGSVESIDSYAFNTLTVKSITFGTENPAGDKGLDIKPGAFRGTDLTSIEFPADMYNIGTYEMLTARYIVDNVFYYAANEAGATESNPNLATFTVAAGNKHYAAKDGVLYSVITDTNIHEHLLLSPKKNSGDNGVITIPKTVKTLQNGSFPSTENVRRIVFENFTEGESGYGQKSLTIGTFRGYQSTFQMAVPVFGSEEPGGSVSALEEIVFPAHLETLFSKALSGINPKDGEAKLVLTFTESPTASLGVEFEQHAIYNAPAVKEIRNLRLARIEDRSIASCSKLTTIELRADSTVQEITVRAFSSNGSLESITIPASVKEIKESAFESCGSLSAVNFATEGKLEKIDTYAFKGCTKLSKLTLPEGLKSINDGAFANCTLESVYVPTSLQFLNWLTNTKVLDFDIAEGHQYLKVDTDGNVYYYPVAGDEANKQLAWAPPAEGEFYLTTSNGTVSQQNNKALTSVTVAEGVTQIPSNMFKYCENITTVFIPYTVTHIYDNAFNGCYGITEVIIEDDPENGKASQLTYIGQYAFQNCSNLVTLHIPATVTNINTGAFQNCSSFIGESAELGLIVPSAITILPSNVFRNTAIAKVTTGSNITELQSYAFGNCTNLTEFAFPATLQKIGQYAFLNTGLTRVELGPEVYMIGSGAFSGCKSLKYFDMSLTKFTVLEIVLSSDPTKSNTIFNDINSRCYVETLILPEGVTAIPDEYFRSFDCIKEVVLPANLQKVGKKAFLNKTTLQSITLPQYISFIEEGAFNGCTNLNSVVFESQNSPLSAIGAEAFKNTGLTSIDLPNQVVDIAVSAFENAPLTSFDFTGVKNIGNYAFRNCPLTSINIPSSIVTIGTMAFANCSEASSIIISDGVTEIGYSAFSNNTKVNAVVIPSTVNKLGGNPFVNLPNATLTCNCNPALFKYESGVLTNAAGNVFYYYAPQNNASTFAFPTDKGVITIMPGAFSASKLQSIVIPQTVTAIADYAFAGSTLLATVELPNNLASIGNYAFADCSSLNNVNVPATVNTIGNYAFSGCSALSNIVINNTSATVGAGLFFGCSALTSTIPGLPLKAYMYAGTGVTEATISYTDATDNIPYEGNPDSIRYYRFAEGIFANCANLTTVTIDVGGMQNVILGAKMFENSGLTTFKTTNGNIFGISAYAFSGSSVESVTVGNGRDTNAQLQPNSLVGIAKLYVDATYIEWIDGMFDGVDATNTIRFVQFKSESKIKETVGEDNANALLASGATLLYGKETQGEEVEEVTLTEDEIKMLEEFAKFFEIDWKDNEAALQDALLNYKKEYAYVVYPIEKEFFSLDNASSMIKFVMNFKHNEETTAALEKELQDTDACMKNELLNNWYRYVMELTDALKAETFTEAELNWIAEHSDYIGKEDQNNKFLQAFYDYKVNFGADSTVGYVTTSEVKELTSYLEKEIGVDNLDKLLDAIVKAWADYRNALYAEVTGKTAPTLTNSEQEALYGFLRGAGLTGNWDAEQNDYYAIMLGFKKNYTNLIPVTWKEFMETAPGNITGFVKESGGDPSGIDADKLANEWYNWCCQLSEALMSEAFTKEELEWLNDAKKQNILTEENGAYAAFVEAWYEYKTTFSKTTPIGDVTEDEAKELTSFIYNIQPDIEKIAPDFIGTLLEGWAEYRNYLAVDLGFATENDFLTYEDKDLIYELVCKTGGVPEDKAQEYLDRAYEKFLAYKQDLGENGYTGPTSWKEFAPGGELEKQLTEFLIYVGLEPKDLSSEFENLLTNWYSYLVNHDYIVEG